MSSNDFDFRPLTDEDKELFNMYKETINNRIRETFPTVCVDYNLQPISIRQQLGCGMFYTYKVRLPNDEIAQVAFHLGGKRITPLVDPPHFEISKSD